MLNKKHFALFAVAFVAVGAGLFSTVWFVTQETSPSDDQKHFSKESCCCNSASRTKTWERVGAAKA